MTKFENLEEEKLKLLKKIIYYIQIDKEFIDYSYQISSQKTIMCEKIVKKKISLWKNLKDKIKTHEKLVFPKKKGNASKIFGEIFEEESKKKE